MTWDVLISLAVFAGSLGWIAYYIYHEKRLMRPQPPFVTHNIDLLNQKRIILTDVPHKRKSELLQRLDRALDLTDETLSTLSAIRKGHTP